MSMIPCPSTLFGESESRTCEPPRMIASGQISMYKKMSSEPRQLYSEIRPYSYISIPLSLSLSPSVVYLVFNTQLVRHVMYVRVDNDVFYYLYVLYKAVRISMKVCYFISIKYS